MSDIEVFRGEEKLLNYTVTDDDGQSIDLTDKDVYFVVKTELPPYGSEVFEIQGGNKKADGTCDVLLTELETDIESKLYFYELWVEYPGGEDYSAEIGRFFVRQRVEK